MKITFSFAWYDFWIGAYLKNDGRVDREVFKKTMQRTLYICFLPMCLIKIRFPIHDVPWG